MGRLLWRGREANPARVLRPLPARTRRARAAARAAGSTREPDGRGRGAQRKRVAARPHAVARLAPRRRRCAIRNRCPQGQCDLQGSSRRSGLYPCVLRGHRDNRADEPAAVGIGARRTRGRCLCRSGEMDRFALRSLRGLLRLWPRPCRVGRLRLSLREPDAAASHPYEPEHTFRTRMPLQADDVVAVQIPLSASATLFRAGESLRLVIAGRYPQPRNPWFGHFPAHYRSNHRGRISIHWGGERQSLLRIPVVR